MRCRKVAGSVRTAVLLLLFIFFTPGLSSAGDDAGLVRAKIGILVSSGAKHRMAKSRDRIRAGEMLRIYVHPEKAAYIYVVYSDRKTAMLLNSVAQKTAGASLVLPSANESYEIDGTSPFEQFTIVCSPAEIPEVASLLTGDAAHGDWVALENKLADQSRVDLTEKSDLPFAIAGNVRGGVTAGPGPEAVAKLKIYSGNGFVVKKFEFSVKK